MVLRWTLLSTLLLATLALPEKRTYDTHSYYVLRHNPSISYAASLADVVTALDVELVEQVGELRDHWVVKRRRSAGVLAAREASDPVLSRFESLKARAASPVIQRSESADIARRVVSSVDYLSLQTLRRRVKRAPPPALPPPHEPQSKVVADHLGIKDPLFPKQWHLVNDEFPQFMMNVTGVWEMGLTGKGIISSFIDDGLDYTSEDLVDNFVSLLSILGLFVLHCPQGCRRLLRL
jgi:kexin